MPRPQGVNLTGKVVPTDTSDTYPVIDPIYGIDGWRSVVDHAARNAIPTPRRREGMVVYCQSDQIPWQLKPPAWAGDDTDWVPYGNLQPYVAPSFSAFYIASQPQTIITGATTTGTGDFKWSIINPGNITPNSISLLDITMSTVLASGLPDTGSHTIASPFFPTYGALTPNTHIWGISATDLKGNAITYQFAIRWVVASDKTYYVDNATGSDSNTGLLGSPWATLQHASDRLDVGDAVIVRVGSGPYVGFTMGWDTTGIPSGASGHPILWAFDPGATINHKCARTADAIDIEGCSYIHITGATITNDGTVTRAGIRLSGSVDGIGTYGNQLVGNTVTGAGRFGILGGFCNHSLVEGNVISGILAGGGNTTGHGIYWANSLVDATIRLNTVSGCGNNAVHLNGDASAGGSGVAQNCLIERNVMHGNSLTYQGAAINPDGLVNSIIRNNLIYDEIGNGIALYHQDGATGSTGNLIVNNTVIMNSAGKWALNINSDSINNTIFNNIFINLLNFTNSLASGAVTIDSSSLEGLVSDHNIFSDGFSSDGQSSIGNFLGWQNATAGDAHSAIVTSLVPMFGDPAGGDYHNLATAPQTDTGIDTLDGLSPPSIDIDGTPRPFDSLYDCGCYEYNPNLPQVIAHTPSGGSVGVRLTATAQYNQAIVNTPTFAIQTATGVPVAGSTSYNSGTHTFTFTPTSPFPTSTTLSASIGGAQNGGGDTQPGAFRWSFATADAPNLGPFSVFSSNFVPATPAYFDSGGTELGMRFSSDVAGAVTGIRFYKGTTNVGIHTCHLWSNTGTSLGAATFSGESSSGWQSQVFASPIPILASTVYVCSYYAPDGHYSVDLAFFATSPYDAAPLHAPADVPAGNRNGVTSYGSAFPTSVGTSGVVAATSYGVDVLFDSRTPYDGQQETPLNGVATFTFNVPIANTPTAVLKDGIGVSISGVLSGGPLTWVFTPDSNLSGHQQVFMHVSGATDAAGNAMAVESVWSYRSMLPPTAYTLWDHGSVTPGTVDQGDGSAYTIGVVFKSDSAGTVTKISFYKSTANTGTHVAGLWSDAGTLLASKTFSGESSSGWQSQAFDTPVAIAAGTYYRAGVLMPAGHYSFDSGYFAAGYTGGGGHLSVSAPPTKNAVFNAGGSLTFPDSGGSGNFWVDVEVLV